MFTFQLKILILLGMFFHSLYMDQYVKELQNQTRSRIPWQVIKEKLLYYYTVWYVTHFDSSPMDEWALFWLQEVQSKN